MDEPIPYILELEIPVCPPRLDNVFRLHYHARNRLIQDHHSLIHHLTIGKKPNSPLKTCQITIIRHCPRFLDYDNLVSAHKGFVDGLVHAGVIKDDSYAVTGTWHVSQVFRSKKEGEPFTYLKVEGLDSPTKGKVQKGPQNKPSEERRESHRRMVKRLNGRYFKDQRVRVSRKSNSLRDLAPKPKPS